MKDYNIINTISILKKNNFIANLINFSGINAWLIYPSINDINWTQENKIYRSSIWSFNGDLLSAGFPKFTNWGENIEHFPLPDSLENTQIVEKIDGSLVICDYVNNIFSMRTRGSHTYKNQLNYKDFELLPERHPQIISFLKEHPNLSLLFEIVTPNQKIVISYSKIDFYFIGAINKEDYSLLTQQQLDAIASDLKLKRPSIWHFSSIDEILQYLETATQIEGYCIYSNNGQTIHKLKSKWYLIIHSFKEKLSFTNLVDLYFNKNCPETQEEYLDLLKQFTDWECIQIAKPFIEKLYENIYELKQEFQNVQKFIQSLRKDLSRKEQAELIHKYIPSKYTTIAFSFLDKKSIDNRLYKRLLLQKIKEKM